MANDVNVSIIVGRLTRDPVSKQIGQNNTVVTFSLASGKSYKSNGQKVEKTTYIDCTAWGKLGDIVMKFCKKGKQVCVTGSLEQDRWEKDGQQHSKHKINVQELQMLGSKQDGQGNNNQGGQNNYQNGNNQNYNQNQNNNNRNANHQGNQNQGTQNNPHYQDHSNYNGQGDPQYGY